MSFPSPPTLYDSPRWNGLRIGLLGGSFNPPHAGHMHIAQIAKRAFGLDCIWWIITPQNPLKDKEGIAPYDARCQAVQDMTANIPYMIPTHLERDLDTNYTFETVSHLRVHYPKTDFLWICGMDNARIFHKWDRWQDLLQTIPITFIARPPARSMVQNCPLRRTQIPQYTQAAGRHTSLKAPSITWLQSSKMLDISSTQIRNSLK